MKNKNNPTRKKFLIFQETELKKLFLFATLQTHFLFKGKFYDQIDGAAMSSPLAPLFSNIFMGFLESKWLNEYNLSKPKFYLRYVDDILAAFEKEQDSLMFLNFLNNNHPKIYHRKTYHKSTYAELLLNFKSFTSFSYKIS